MKDMLLSLKLKPLVNILQIYLANHLNKFYVKDEAVKIDHQFVGIKTRNRGQVYDVRRENVILVHARFEDVSRSLISTWMK